MSRIATDLTIEVPGGEIAGLDFGGDGPGVLLVHGTGHNAAVWTDVAAGLVSDHHLVAVDLRGHGQSSSASSTDAEQYWRDLEVVLADLGWTRPALVGHSTGDYAVTAAVASGIVEAASVCVVDGFVLDDRDTAARGLVQMRSDAALEQLRGMDYGSVGDDEWAEELVARVAREAPGDWLNAGARPALVETVTRRSLARQDGRWLRRPTLDEVATVSAPDPSAGVFPSVDVYDRVTCPLQLVLADGGLYADRRDDVAAIAAARPGRRLAELESNHSVPMTRPADLVGVLREQLASITG